MLYKSSEISMRIKHMAKQRGKTLGEVLSDCGLGVNTVSKMSKGTDILTLNFARIADVLDCSVDYLLGRSDAPEKTAPGSPGADEVDSVIIEMFSRLSPEDKAIVLDLIERLLSGAKA